MSTTKRIYHVTDQLEKIIRFYLNDAPEKYIQACLYGYRSSSLCATTYTKYNKLYLPKKKSEKPKTHILKQFNLKMCTKCHNILDVSNFRKNSFNLDGLQNECKKCHQKNTSKTQTHREAKRRAIKINATPIWSELDQIKEFYNQCEIGFHVDHVIPLNNPLVCGLHVMDNLQYLSAHENCSKGNCFSL